LTSATNDAAFYPKSGAEPIRGRELENLSLRSMEINGIIRRWGKRYDANVLRALMWMPEVAPADLDGAAGRERWSRELESQLKISNGNGPRYRVHEQAASEGVDAAIVVSREYHGTVTIKLLHQGFFRSPEYRRLIAIGHELKSLVGSGARVERGKDGKDVASFLEAIDWLMAQAKQGQSIQRYKGLGEMNPSQLWETTVNPETRRLMQVRIEDAVAADEIFTTLMGDQVEPRREFIERNALAVANLDV
jgi:DNA gyrase subunit B